MLWSNYVPTSLVVAILLPLLLIYLFWFFLSLLTLPFIKPNKSYVNNPKKIIEEIHEWAFHAFQYKTENQKMKNRFPSMKTGYLKYKIHKYSLIANKKDSKNPIYDLAVMQKIYLLKRKE